MPTFEDSIVVRTSPLLAYELTQDYSKRLAWDPFLRDARLLAGAKSVAKGVRAWCVSQNGIGMETEYVSAEPGRVAAVVMTRGPWPLERFAGAWLFRQHGDENTRIVFRYHLRGKPRLLRWILEPLMAFWFRREMRQRLLALKGVLEQVCQAPGC